MRASISTHSLFQQPEVFVVLQPSRIALRRSEPTSPSLPGYATCPSPGGSDQRPRPRFAVGIGVGREPVETPVQEAIQPVEVADPVQRPRLDERLVEEPVRVTSARVATGVEPDLLALALEILVPRPPQIDVRQLGHVNVQAADLIALHRLDDADGRRCLSDPLQHLAVGRLVIDERLIGDCRSARVPSTRAVAPLPPPPPAGRSWPPPLRSGCRDRVDTSCAEPTEPNCTARMPALNAVSAYFSNSDASQAVPFVSFFSSTRLHCAQMSVWRWRLTNAQQRSRCCQ